MVLNDMEKQVGKDNFKDAVHMRVAMSRRQFLAGTLVVPTAAGLYWGYGKLEKDPVRVGVIGTGDQGKAHISSMNPDYCQVVAFSDIRPSNQKNTRALLDQKFPATAKDIKLHLDYHELLADKNVEMVIIAVPLFLHAEVSIAALKAGKHVLCEKLMAKTVRECKDMVQAADVAQKMLAIGHQRHYSYLYANCRAIIEQKDILGDIRYIRALWHRNQTMWGSPGAETGKYDGWFRQIPSEDMDVDFKKYGGYDSIEELVRWRLYDKTGAGLVAELGSHQLDAASIFLGKKHPIAVEGVGVNSFFKDKRQVEDHVFLIFEFGEDADKAVVTYSSIGTNAFDGYGEEVMGTKGTLIVQEEHDAYVFKEGAKKDTQIKWAEDRVGRPTTESGSTKQWVSSVETPDTLTSRGYREEQEHMAWLIRHPEILQYPSKANPFPEEGRVPRCHARVAMADAVIALTSNLAMKTRKRVEFKHEWFDAYSDAVPETEV